MPKSVQIRLFLCSFFGGIAVCSVLPWWTVCVAGTGLFLRKRARWVFILGFLLGFMRMALTYPSLGIGDAAFYRDAGLVKLRAMVAVEPDIRNDAQYVVVEAQKVEDRFVVSGRILLKLDRFPEYNYGDILEVSGKIQKPAEFDTFSYADYLAKDGIYAVMYRPGVRLLEHPLRVNIWSLVYPLKSLVRAEVERLFAEPGASIVLGLLLGMRASIPSSVLENFQRTGLTHILAISGYNITLLITIVGLLLKSRGRKVRFVFTVIAIAFFALLTGLSASVVRASIMGALAVFVVFQGRKTDPFIILLLSGFFMVFFSPRILVWDISFQLSFASTLGLLALLPLWEPFARKLPALFGEGLLVTLAATVFTAPIVLYHFGTFSLISPLANLIFLPLIPLIMFLSFLALISSFLFLPLTWLFVGMGWVLLVLLIEGVAMIASIPFAFVKIPALPWWAVSLYYLALWKFIASHTPKLGQSGSLRPVHVSESLSMEQSGTRMK